MNNLREQIKELVRQQQFMSDDGGLVADRILSLLPKDEAEAKLPEGLGVKLYPNGWYAITRDGYWEKGWYDTEADALAAALKAPPVPNAEKPDPRKIAPNGRAMVRYRKPINGALYGLDDDGQWWVWRYGYGLGRTSYWVKPEMSDAFIASGNPCTFDGSPLPTETKSREGFNPSPNVTFADMRRLAKWYTENETGMVTAIYEVFKEPA